MSINPRNYKWTDNVETRWIDLLFEPLRSFVSKYIGGGPPNAGLYQIPVISYICEFLERYRAVIPREPQRG